MTEDEAKMKWCPFARVICITGDPEKPNTGSYGPANRLATERDAVAIQSANCIGSHCAAWREIKQFSEKQGDVVIGGYCGLAGKP